MIEDVAAAMDALGEAAGVEQFVLFGFCSGGYQGLDAAMADRRIIGLVMFDAHIYPTARARFNRYRMRLRQHGPIRAVTGWAGRAISRLIKSRDPDSAAEARKREAYMIGLPSPREFARDALALLERGVKVHMVYAGEGFEHYNYASQFDDAFRKYGLTGRVTTKFFAEMDHVATGITAQAELIAHLRDWVLKGFSPAKPTAAP
jgi:pimeloyl-ACP methyl ester carboxylesterase